MFVSMSSSFTQMTMGHTMVAHYTVCSWVGWGSWGLTWGFGILELGK